MEKNEMIKKLLGGFLIGSLLLAGGGLAMAGTNDTNTSNQSSSTAPIHGLRMPGVGKMNAEINQSVLNPLVAGGTLIQAQVDTILAQQQQLETERQTQMEKMQSMSQTERETYCQENKPERADLLAQLVTDGTITQEQADAIKTATQAEMQKQRQVELDSSLSGLVEKNVITNNQVTAIKDKLSEVESTRQAQIQAKQGLSEQERQTQMENMKSMTAEERQAYMEANKPEIVNPLAELVTAGTITQNQADQVAQAIPFMQGGREMHHGSGNEEGGMRGPGPHAVVSN